ncbi:sialic acid-binding Ig-like lectin 6 [Callorhinchus milii]|uniref:sialic acid-binding Ig-like lectin 6 n=1 Tax=Callorhinchus milii TaxID=7868 RepID=UPI001C3FA944|nr:sialic acid-binding Ig-like lectin 6 [Callorhinchus milii]
MLLFPSLLFTLLAGAHGGRILEVTQPREVNVRRGESVTLNCTYNCTGIQSNQVYAAWYRGFQKPPVILEKNNENCSEHKGVVSCWTSVKIANVSPGESAYTYYCEVIVTAENGTVEKIGGGTRLRIYETPRISPSVLVKGRESTLNCSALVYRSFSLSFICVLHGKNVNGTVPTDSGRNESTKFITSHLKITAELRDNRSVCVCQINPDIHTAAARAEVRLNIEYGPQDPIIKYRTKEQAKYLPVTTSIPVPMGSFLELTCFVDSNPQASVKWKKGEETLAETNQTQGTLTINSTSFKLLQHGIYVCEATNKHGHNKTEISITLQPHNQKLICVWLPVTVIAVVCALTIACWVMKRRLKEPGAEAIELSPESNEHPSHINETDTIYAEVQKKALPKHQTPAQCSLSIDDHKPEEENEVSYADIMIRRPKPRGHTHKPEHRPYIAARENKTRSKDASGSPYHNQAVAEETEYAAVHVSSQNLRNKFTARM